MPVGRGVGVIYNICRHCRRVFEDQVVEDTICPACYRAGHVHPTHLPCPACEVKR